MRSHKSEVTGRRASITCCHSTPNCLPAAMCRRTVESSSRIVSALAGSSQSSTRPARSAAFPCCRKCAVGFNPRREIETIGADLSGRFSVRITSTAVNPLPMSRTGSSGPIWLSVSDAQGSVMKRVRGPLHPFARGSLGGRCPTARMARSA